MTVREFCHDGNDWRCMRCDEIVSPVDPLMHDCQTARILDQFGIVGRGSAIIVDRLPFGIKVGMSVIQGNYRWLIRMIERPYAEGDKGSLLLDSNVSAPDPSQPVTFFGFDR